MTKTEKIIKSMNGFKQECDRLVRLVEENKRINEMKRDVDRMIIEMRIKNEAF